MSTDSLTYRIAFASVHGMGIDLANKILDVIPSEQEFFSLSEKELKSITGSHSKLCEREYRNAQLERAKREVEFVEESHIGVTYFTDNDFPARLLNAPDAPILLYTCGRCNPNPAHAISIVGTRRATVYGAHFCDTLIADLAERLPDLVVISGLAYGIDISAHRACLRYGVPTVAVQARGLNKIYPADHRNDAKEIVKRGGAIVTDYQSQDEIHRGNFLARNRIIAALSDCTIVVESAEKGGALVTASIAQSYNRDVFALPGRTGDPYSTGCNNLIKNNKAGLITGADDLIESMRWIDKTVTKGKTLELFPELSEEEQRIVDVIRDMGDVHINTLTEKLGIPVYKIMSTLVDLDCRRIILAKPGCRYCLA